MIGYVPSAGAILGKAPHAPEFLRVHSGDAVLAGFDAWLAERFEWALGHGGPEWQAAFVEAPIFAFGFRPVEGPGSFVAGVLGPSHDSGGRRYPLIVAASTVLAAELVGEPEVAPLVFEALWAQAGEVLSSVLRGETSNLPEAALGTCRADALPVDESLALYRGWVNALTLAELWSLLGLSARDAALRLRLLVAAVEPFRGIEPASTRLALRVPLGQAAGAGLCFWLDLMRRGLDWHHTVPSFFWAHDGARGSALLCLGEPPKQLLAELFVPSDRYDEVCDLTTTLGETVVESLPPLTPRLLEVVENETATVEQLLAALLPG